jgi:hypothetical protein
MADYEYDVFFSYKKDPLITEWIANVVSRLEFWLTQELGGRPARIFIDRDHIEIGDRWPDALRHALRHSRSMAAIWSPSYFHSQWCVSEWKSFLARGNAGWTRHPRVDRARKILRRRLLSR